MDPGFRIRRVAAGDRRLIFEWANDPLVRAMSFSPAAIRWDEHQAWFAARLADTDSRLYLVVDRSGVPIGLVRFQRDARGRWELGVNLAAERRGRGLGTRVIAQGVRTLRKELGPVTIRARTRPANRALIRAAQRAGFTRVDAERVRGQPALTLALAPQ